jgi:hypothetical protein
MSEAVTTDPRGAWFAWRTAMAKRGDPRGDDPLACYEFGVHIGGRAAIERMTKLSRLVPLLQDLQDLLLESAVEREAEGDVV